MAMGRPEVFTKEWADEAAKRIPDLMRNGESIAEVCAALEMSKESFYKCKEISTDFSDAVKMGTMMSEAWWTKLGRGGAAGKVDINATTWIFNMKNRFDWKDKKETDHTSSDGSMTPKGFNDFYSDETDS